ncbi:TPA: DUF411 domain-containing protein [Stenotrophomonas maltophilia]|uniref:DUF411 domain-containing protein n=1 Tax=Stenotrophomonas TaxID=40323 RepID=UPI0013D9325E|nr:MULTISPECIES: DUF411 domain-containing protein [Stenotrophomonas]MBH1592320.1 DUF411 domain-containing protein [Stenotrophomonas maltophilia]MDH2021460.1 DUF411 domain-containing protein [Stenotrophomonas sp. GD03680]HEL3749478.1 DUF411 domain-containing protein [Stenotrophomonas maltophilia]HEL7728234.1 DUF411 domain-containing protein [Stenotrophomonas maltophilia]HEL7732170.1 DUF411 domain-containing protein [Stenotrophomonas maltophilia]
MNRSLSLGLLLASILSGAGCARAAEEVAAAPGHAHAAADAASVPDAQLPTAIVHKTASCGCCGVWIEHLQAAGFAVDVRDTDDMNPIKQRLGVPVGKGSCHTAEIDGYVVEGHVPAEDIKRLLKERPAARGLVLPGMPAGSPGMEMPDGYVQPYTVELVRGDGSTEPFAHHGHGG